LPGLAWNSNLLDLSLPSCKCYRREPHALGLCCFSNVWSTLLPLSLSTCQDGHQLHGSVPNFFGLLLMCLFIREVFSVVLYKMCNSLISFWCLLTAFKPYSFSFPFCLTHWQAKSLMLPSLIPVGNSNLM
jgi:hypothetical protein